MTVHGAKGLEAPIVILADTTTPPAGLPHPPRLLALAPVNAPPGAPDRLVWAGPKANDVKPMADGARVGAERRCEHEYRRLLYVAMTRASERLIVCGTDGERKRAGRLLVRPDRATRSSRSASTRAGRRRRRRGHGAFARRRTARRRLPPSCRDAGRGRDTAGLAASQRRRRAAASGADPAFRPRRRRCAVGLASQPASGAAAGAAARHHRAPAAAVAARHSRRAPRRGRAPLSGAAGHEFIDGRERDAHRRSRSLRAARRPALRALFAPGSRAEVPIVGRRIGGRAVVSGQVDRLAVTPDAVLIADYKTNRPAPTTSDEAARVIRPMSGSSRSTARCWRGSIPAGRSAPP